MISSLLQVQRKDGEKSPVCDQQHLGFLMGRFLAGNSSSLQHQLQHSDAGAMLIRDCDLMVDRFDLGRRPAAAIGSFRVPTVAMDGDILVHVRKILKLERRIER
jgi:hypothetical protein